MPSLDSVRGIAVLMVVLFHGFASYAWVTNCGARWGSLAAAVIDCGRFGVNVFFVLSGFLITGILVRSRERPDFYSNFYLRRVLRILPAYLLMLVVLKVSHTVDWRFALAATFFLANFSRIFGAPMDEYGSLWVARGGGALLPHLADMRAAARAEMAAAAAGAGDCR